MSSADSDRSISSGISIPQWMKSKIGDRYDIEETFSPPTHDDTFFYIRYPKSTQPEKVTPNYQPINSVLDSRPAKPDFSQHTQPCKKFIPEAGSFTNTANNTSWPQSVRGKSQGTDDGYTGEGAACGKSVVQVAHQMIAGNRIRGYGKGNSDVPSPEALQRRRGSKSLPASPLGSPSTSPKSSRKQVVQNRYFTGVFGPISQDNRYPGSWILSGFLGQRDGSVLSPVVQEETTESVEKLTEKQSEMRRNKSMTSLLVRMATEGSKEDEQSDGEKSPGLAKKDTLFRAKPSELREMNFLSPTSM